MAACSFVAFISSRCVYRLGSGTYICSCTPALADSPTSITYYLRLVSTFLSGIIPAPTNPSLLPDECTWTFWERKALWYIRTVHASSRAIRVHILGNKPRLLAELGGDASVFPWGLSYGIYHLGRAATEIGAILVSRTWICLRPVPFFFHSLRRCGPRDEQIKDPIIIIKTPILHGSGGVPASARPPQPPGAGT